MKTRPSVILSSLACLSLIAMAAAAPADHEDLEVSVPSVAWQAGADTETLRAGGLNPEQLQTAQRVLPEFLQDHRPRLMTYRAIWAEMVERLGNLKQSAQENTFDPCEFVTDDAVEAATVQVEQAAERFRKHCRKAAEMIGRKASLTAKQKAIMANARYNRGLPSPYRWLSLTKRVRTNIQRIHLIHRARVKLAEKYPQMADRLSKEDPRSRIRNLLSKTQLAELDRLAANLSRSTSKPAEDEQ